MRMPLLAFKKQLGLTLHSLKRTKVRLSVKAHDTIHIISIHSALRMGSMSLYVTM